MREEEADLSFADFGGSKRLYPAPTPERDISETGNYAKSMARREGFADSLRSLVESASAETLTEVRDLRMQEPLARREGFEPPTLRFEAGFKESQETPETRGFGHLAHIA
jgi:hypothetical protein